MAKTLIIAEKPSVGREIAKVLGIKSQTKGYFENNNYVVSWAQGHLVELAEPHQYDAKYKRWSLEHLPIVPETFKLNIIYRTKKQYQLVTQLMHRSDVTTLINACDAGREGELIFRNIYIRAGCKKPIQRLWINNMTADAIRQGFKNLKPGTSFDRLFHAAQCRSHADWLIGINATREYTLLYHALLTVGRVQSPTLALLVKRELEIRAFKPEPYYEIIADFGAYLGQWYKGKETHVKELDKAEAIKQKVENKIGTIQKIIKEHQRELPPLLYDLTSLQRDANQRFGFSADKTLKTAQDLYEKSKAITYPRTDSRYLPSEMRQQLEPLIHKLNLPPYQPFIDFLTHHKPIISKRIINDAKVSDHHAIIPTGTIPTSLSPDAQKLFDLIVRRYLAIFYPAAEFDKTKISTEVEQELFGTSFRVCTQEGWKQVYAAIDVIKQSQTTAESSQAQTTKNANYSPKQYGEDQRSFVKDESPPDFLKEGQQYPVQSVAIEKKMTKPPKRYTEASLLGAMEHAGKMVDDEELRDAMKQKGLGTPATRAEIIERLIKVEYIYRSKKTLFPTDKGIQLIHILHQDLKSPELTGEWEYKLRQIEFGKGSANQFMHEIIQMVDQVYHKVKADAANHPVEFSPNQQAAQSHSSYQTRATKTSATEDSMNTAPVGRKSASRNPSKTKDFGICPVCKEGNVLKSDYGYFCSEKKHGCGFSLPKAICKKNITQKMVRQLLTDGKTDEITGFKSKLNKPFSAVLTLNEQGKIKFVFL